MSRSSIEQLFGFIGTPFGLIGIGIVLPIEAQHDRPPNWLLQIVLSRVRDLFSYLEDDLPLRLAAFRQPSWLPIE